MEIPNIDFEGTEIVRDILEVPIKVNKEDKIVKMVKINSGKRREIIKKYVKTGINNQQITGEVTDPMGIEIGVLTEAIIEAPFETTEKALNNLPEDVIDYLYDQYQEWTKKKTAN
jgi:hypothetical protein